MDMDNKETPPPYDDGCINKGYGLAYPPASAPPSTSVPLMVQNYAPPVVINQPQQPPINNVVVNVAGGDGCPICHNKSWTGTYSCCAWLWCLCCFPCGLICCLCMRKKKCKKCGFTVT